MDIREASEGQDATRIGPYRIVRRLGQGGMGAVYEAVHELIGRKVAIKVLHPQYAADAELTERFFNEARAVNLVDHPGLVQVSDYGRLADGTSYIVMEFLKGETLGQRLRRLGTTLPVTDVLRLAWQIADSLLAAHEKGIVHRDLKPDNIMLVPDPHMPGGERTKLLDFGIAKLGDGWVGREGHTVTGTVLGTPAYMAPEQCAGSTKIDAKADVYSLGCVLYHMLSGRPPFVGEGPGAVLGMQQFVEPEPLAKQAPAAPLDLAMLTHSLLAKSRDNRPTMAEVGQRLEAMGAHARRASSQQRVVTTHLPPSVDSGLAGFPHAYAPASGSTLGTSASEALSRRMRSPRMRWSMAAAGIALLATIALAMQLRPVAERRPAAPVVGGTQASTGRQPEGPLFEKPMARAAVAANPGPAKVEATRAIGEPRLDQKTTDERTADDSADTSRESPSPALEPTQERASPDKAARVRRAPAQPASRPALPPATPELAADEDDPQFPPEIEAKISAAEQYLREQNWNQALRTIATLPAHYAQEERGQWVFGIASCHMRDRQRAQLAYGRLHGKKRGELASVCRAAEVPLMEDRIISADTKEKNARLALSQAWAFYRDARMASAMSEAKQAIQGGLQDGWIVFGLAACRSGDAGLAQQAWGQVSVSRKSELESICLAKGIRLDAPTQSSLAR